MLYALLSHPKENDAYNREKGIERIANSTATDVEMVVAEECYPCNEHKDAESAEEHLSLTCFVLKDVSSSQSCYYSAQNL